MTQQTLRICHWNANGLAQHAQEIKAFINNQNIDIMLISETHFTTKNFLKIHKYSIYDTKHPDRTAHGGSAVIIKDTIKHHEASKYIQEHIQATSVTIDDWTGPLTITAVYCPPKHTIKENMFTDFFKSLGHRFIVGGDYNAKHTHWGSRLITSKGRELLKAINLNNLQHVSSGKPTYWPSDSRKTPDLIDFCVTKGIATDYMKAESCLDLSSDHSPVLVTLSTKVIMKQKAPSLCNKKTNWNYFRCTLDELLTCHIPLKTEEDLDCAAKRLCNAIQQAAWKASPADSRVLEKRESCPIFIKRIIAEKRKLRKKWQSTRSNSDKRILNRITKELKTTLHEHKNRSIQSYLKRLSNSQSTEYSLWKATKKTKQPQKSIPPIRKDDGNWARTDKEKASLFANHLTNTFMPFLPETPEEEDEENEEAEILQFLDESSQMASPIEHFKIKEVKYTIQKEINPKKAPGFDLINGRILKELSEKGMRYITILFNAILRIGYFPDEWKIAEIILIPKPGKKPELVQSYRPISLLPIISKVFEKLFLKRLLKIIKDNRLIPDHQFGFRSQHATIEQVHRVVNIINDNLEEKRYCSAAFLDISQAFDKVWHEGLLYKLKKELPYQYFRILRSYLSSRRFFIRYQEEHTSLFPINAGVPQGSVLGPILYLLYTADFPTTRSTTIATFADDTVILASHTDPKIASVKLQLHLNTTQLWLQKWRIKVNEVKSTHVTFTLRKGTCPPVVLNNTQLPQNECVKYLGVHLDRRLTWQKHIFTKRKQLGLKLSKMYWLMGRSSDLSMENKLLLYKVILKPIWTYGIQLWGTASHSNIAILQRFQSKVLRGIVNAPWYVPNDVIQHDLHMTSVKEEITNFSVKYRKRIAVHPNKVAVKVFDNSEVTHRLKRFKPSDLNSRFN